MKLTVEKKSRGFVLIVVLVIAATAVAIAIGMLSSSGLATTAAAHTVEGDLAAGIAASGMERAEAYAVTIAGTTIADWDLALDPDGDADCTTLAASGNLAGGETGNMNVPKFTDGGIVTLAAPWSKRYYSVALDGGAYFIRFDDDSDDMMQDTLVPNPVLMSGNTLAGGCDEGSVMGVDNPARDRNGEMWITVIGIHPGTDVNLASHRTVLRKLMVNPNSGPGPSAFAVGGNIDAAGSLEGCSELSGISAGGNITGTLCTCNDSNSGGATNATNAAACAACATPCAGPPPNVQTNQPVPAPSVKPATDASWYDWTSSCNFYMDPAAVGGGLYYWDSAGLRGAPAVDCGTYAGNLPAPSTLTTDQGSCWIPLALIGGGVVALGMPEFAAEIGIVPPATFHPLSTAGGRSFPSTAYFPLLPVTTINEPEWGAECPKPASPSDFQWPLGGPPAPKCTTCDGAHSILRIGAAGGTSAFEFENSPAGTITAYPTAVFYHKGTFNVANNGTFVGVKPTTQTDPAYPMISMIVDGDFDVGNPNQAIWFGVGTKKGLYPSMVIQGNWVGGPSNIEFAAAGGIYVLGNMDVKNEGINLFGPVQITGNLTVGPGGPSDINWQYDADLFAGAGIIGPARPLRGTNRLGL